jgi:hypothetical protein
MELRVTILSLYPAPTSPVKENYHRAKIYPFPSRKIIVKR